MRKIKRPKKIVRYANGNSPYDAANETIPKDVATVGAIVGSVAGLGGIAATPILLNKGGLSYWQNDDTAAATALIDDAQLKDYGFKGWGDWKTGLYRRPGSLFGPKAAPAEALLPNGKIDPNSAWYKGLKTEAKQNALLENAYGRKSLTHGKYTDEYGSLKKTLQDKHYKRLQDTKKELYKWEANASKVRQQDINNQIRAFENSNLSTPANSAVNSALMTPEASSASSYSPGLINQVKDGGRIPRYEMGKNAKTALAGLGMAGIAGGIGFGVPTALGVRFTRGGAIPVGSGVDPMLTPIPEARPGIYHKPGSFLFKEPEVRSMMKRIDTTDPSTWTKQDLRVLYNHPDLLPPAYSVNAPEKLFDPDIDDWSEDDIELANGGYVRRYEDGGGASNEGQAAGQQAGGGAGASSGGGDYDMGQWKENEKGGGSDSSGGGDSSGGSTPNNSAPAGAITNVPASAPQPTQESQTTPASDNNNDPSQQNNSASDNTPNVSGDNGVSNEGMDIKDESWDQEAADWHKENGGAYKSQNMNQIANNSNAAADFYNNNEALINILGPLAASFIPGVGPLISSLWIGAQGLSNNNMGQVATSALFLPGNIAAVGNAAKAASAAKAGAQATETAAAGTATAGGAASAEAAGVTAGQNAMSGAAQTATQGAQQAQAASSMANNFQTFADRSRRLGNGVRYGQMAYDQTQDQPQGYADGGRVQRFKDGGLTTAQKVGIGIAGGVAGTGLVMGGLNKMGVDFSWGGNYVQPYLDEQVPFEGYNANGRQVTLYTQSSPDVTNVADKATPGFYLRTDSLLGPSRDYMVETSHRSVPRHFNDEPNIKIQPLDKLTKGDKRRFLDEYERIQAEQRRAARRADGGSVRRYAFGGGSYSGLVQATQRPMTSIGRANTIQHKTYNHTTQVEAPTEEYENEEIIKKKRRAQQYEDEIDY